MATNKKKTGFSSLTAILPTLNEEDVIGETLSRLMDFDGLNILVVDDGSKDATRRIVSDFAKSHRNVSLLDRSAEKEKGITASVLAGAAKASTPYILVMDSDLQHPPEKIPELLAALETSDVAVGCRQEIRDWPFSRRLISFGGNSLAKLVLAIRGAPSCSDPVSGFFALRKSVLSEVDGRKAVSRGFKILLDILKQLDRSARIAEIPYTFQSRKSGGSKFAISHILLFLRSLFS